MQVKIQDDSVYVLKSYKELNNASSVMMKHFKTIKIENVDSIIFYRLGDFYEMFCEDAVLGSHELDLTLTERASGNKTKVKMCGIPAHAYETYARRLVEKGYKVAICEQISNEKKENEEVVERQVVRILTAGTVIETELLNESVNNYILCICLCNNTVYYSYADVSTGEIRLGKIDNNIFSQLGDLIMKIQPSEIICNSDMYKEKHKIQSSNIQNNIINKYYDWPFQKNASEEIVKNHYKISTLKGYDISQDAGHICTLGALLQFLLETQKKTLLHISFPILERQNTALYIDAVARKNLELEENSRDKGKIGTLLWVLDETVTAMARRNMRDWLRNPLQNVESIRARQDKVRTLVESPIIRKMIDIQLAQIADIERIVSRISADTCSPRDLQNLSKSILAVPNIAKQINSMSAFADISEGMLDLSSLSKVILDTLVDDPPVSIKDGNMIRPSFSPDLDKLRQLKNGAIDMITEIECRERETTGIKNLKIGYNRVFGYYIEVNRQYSEQVPYHYHRKQTISNNERYATEELKELEDKMLKSATLSLKLETEIYKQLKSTALAYVNEIKTLAKAIANIDTLNSLAKIAVSGQYVCPVIDDSDSIEIISGRHPVVEKSIGRTLFVGNDTKMSGKSDQISIITGPNMAGKSTYMRQVAIIVIMAHMGSFVPASSARIGIVDRVFTRIGANDDLNFGQSTFMVEMVEVANIIANTSNKSLILLDEVGRGTSTYDGLSIAWAVVEYFAKKTDAKTIFATHYHELTELEGKLESVKNYRVTIKEINGEIIFLRKVERGGAMKSYGIEVASLAGLPNAVVLRAREILKSLEAESLVDASPKQPLAAFVDNDRIKDILIQLDINNLTPIKALETLEYVHNLARRGK